MRVYVLCIYPVFTPYLTRLDGCWDQIELRCNPDDDYVEEENVHGCSVKFTHHDCLLKFKSNLDARDL